MTVDTYALRKLYKYIRVADVVDAMDGIGYRGIGLVDPQIQPLWRPMKFCGVAATLRYVPAHRPMWPLNSTEEIVGAIGSWFKEVGHIRIEEFVQEGTVVVSDCGSTPEMGYWGSNNTLGLVTLGAVGIVTNGYARDTDEIELERAPVVARYRGRTMFTGRQVDVEAQTPIGVGGAQVRPGDMVMVDGDGVVVIPQEIAEEVAVHARAILLYDMRERRKFYEKLGRPIDETVNFELVEAYYSQFD